MSRLFVVLQYLLPHHLLGRVIHALSRSEAPWLKNLLIRGFVRGYRPDMSGALEPDPLNYRSFNAFFTRGLRADARPADPDSRSIASPCDGKLECARIAQADELLQAKGHTYTLQALLATDGPSAARLRDGLYATLYLAPYNYHRVHMPLAGRLSAAWHVPGRLFSVSGGTVAHLPGLFARNERVVCAFEGEHGPFVVIMVGALFVGSMSTLWHGAVTPTRARTGVQRLEPRTTAALWQARGAELGTFNMGSTVILLLAPGLARWDAGLQRGAPLRVGQSLGALLP
jgi:phosphatidylserine decarboxylase